MNAPRPAMAYDLEGKTGGGMNGEVNVAKTFLASTSQLSTSERGRVFDFLAKFMRDPAHPSISLERVNNTGDAGMWSARITQGLRAIIHRAGSMNTLLYAGQHDDAYHWAERRRLEHHPITGALQIVETTESAEALLAEKSPAESPADLPGLFAGFAEDYLLSLGVPADWLPTLRLVRFEDQVLTVVERLPEEVGERLLALAGGEFVTPPAPVSPSRPLAENPDNLRRFWVVQDADELREVLDRPLSDWVKFLHPSQRRLVAGDFRGAVKVTGAAGTGKTVVALHRARHLASLGQTVFLTSYVSTLCRNLRRNLQILCTEESLARISVGTIHQRALALARQIMPELRPLESKKLASFWNAWPRSGIPIFRSSFIWRNGRAWSSRAGITTWEEYRDAPRIGRQSRLPHTQREGCWRVFEALRCEMEKQSAYPWEQICEIARIGLETGHVKSLFDAVIVDEVQDLAPSALRLIAELARPTLHNLLLVGDAGQRIYPGGFSLRQLGIDVRGRSHVLRINYRTTEQIRRFADRLMPDAVDDLDSDTYQRKSHCLLHGPTPRMQGFATQAEEDQFIAERIQSLLNEGLTNSEMAIFARTGKRLESLRACLENLGIASHLLSREEDTEPDNAIGTGTMHRAKGLEFKVVFAVDCTAGVLPHDKAMFQAEEAEDGEAALARERQLLYVTLTRARDEAFITWTGTPSPFLEGLHA